MARQYDEKFMGYAATSSHYAASKIILLVQEALQVGSVADIGCAGGTWLSVWHQAGVTDIRGVDGDYVKREDLEIAPELFTAADLSRPLELGRKFEMVQSLEVGEHIDREFADQFVTNIVRAAERYVLFSAAIPGQGGEHHVNEQPYDFWRERLARHGFDAYDFVRPAIASDHRISFWYRYNCILYVHRDYQAQLDEKVRVCRVPDNSAIPDLAPPWFRLRNSIVKSLPLGVRDRLARIKARVAPTGRF
ncbi:hypothetical protein JIR23_24560 [Bradyrhizobium diazoefficiens]|nr:hypothetical protein [Bradyrhizobium diazoefficiens]QQN62709.1 hypothetical protein JIR23_24560 [Bradyrhizobium diazoefficiens]